MLLAIDIGNTNLVLGVFQGDQLEHSWRVATRREETADEYALLCRNLFELAGFSHSQLEGIVICSVVPPLNEAFETMCNVYFGVDPFFVEPAQQDLMPIRYTPVSDVGADRIVTSVAAFRKLEDSAIVVDFGTATTFDAISQPGEYLGGIIAPGLDISAEALFSRAARLPRIEIQKPSGLIGNSTVESMQSGLYYGYLGLVDGILEQMKRELKEAKVIATGGLAPLVAGETDRIDFVEEHLTLSGLEIFYRHFQQKGR